MQQDELAKRASKLLALYADSIRPTLEERDPQWLEAVDRAAEVLRDALAKDPALSIGFLGASQVGKSSIINAFLDERALPSGGVGPLTAQATRVTYRDSNALEARYHDRERFNRLRFALRDHLKRRGEIPESASATDAVSEEVDPDDADLMFVTDTPSDDGGAVGDDDARNKHVSTVCEHMLRSVRLMLTQQDLPSPEDLPRLAVLDALHLVLGQAPLGDPAVLAPWKPGIANIRERLGEAENLNEDENDPRPFKKQLRARAAGWLSPLVASLNVHLRKPALHGLTLVDLPGIKNFADAGGDVARQFIHQRDAGALVIVLRNNLLDEGMHELLMTVLDRYGIIESLLWGAAKADIPLSLVFLVTNVDNVARDEWAVLREEARENDEPLPSPDKVFASVAARVETRLRAQLREALDQRLATERSDGSHDAQLQRVAAAIEALATRANVLCVSAPDYLNIKEESGEGFVKTLEATNIPRLRALFRGLAEERETRHQLQLTEAFCGLHEALSGHIASLARAYEEGGGPATAGFERFHDALDATRQELSRTLAAQRKAAGRALDEDVERNIRELLEGASVAGHKKLKRLRGKAGSMHWSSLNAALARNGSWTTAGGRSIDYPSDLVKAISEQIAGGWDDIVLASVRKTTRALIQSELDLVEQLCARALDLDAKLVEQEHIEEQRALLRSAMNSTVRWTQDRLTNLTNEVEEKLRAEIAPPIEKACEKARKAGQNRGAGAKERIVDAFELGGGAAVDSAIVGAHAVLRRQCQLVLKDIRSSHLQETFDPLQRAFDKLTNAEQARASKQDKAQRRRALASVQAHGTALSALALAAEGATI